MSTNVSKERREQLVAKIKEIKSYIASAPQDENTARLLAYIADIEKDIKGKKYGLVFEEHREAIDEILEQNTPVLTEEEGLFIDNGGQMNFLIEGDNLAALQLLEKTHKGKIDVIYIDPPYNTGAKDWKYNNSFVGGDDAFRHSKWLSFMRSRLMFARELLSEHGIICVTIDDYEISSLWLMLDELFGESNHLGTVTIRNNPKGRMGSRKISQVHEYAIFFGKSDQSRICKLPVAPEEKSHHYVMDENGLYYVKVNLRKQGVDSEGMNADGTYKMRYFPIYYDPQTKEVSLSDDALPVKILPIDSSGNARIWRRDQQGVENLYRNNDLIVDKIKGNYQISFRFRGGLDGQMPKSIWVEPQFSASEYGTNILNDLIGREKFQYPKSVQAVMQCVRCMSQKLDVLVLDFFAGSGTTGHAVMKLNAEDGGKRRFILCTNNENNICRDVTYERIKRVIERDKYEASLKYFKVDFVPISDRLYYEYADELLKHIRELVELENGINFNGNAEIAIVLTEKELDAFAANMPEKCKTIYLGHDVLPSEAQESLFKARGIAVNIIPDYYYRELEG